MTHTCMWCVSLQAWLLLLSVATNTHLTNCKEHTSAPWLLSGRLGHGCRLQQERRQRLLKAAQAHAVVGPLPLLLRQKNNRVSLLFLLLAASGSQFCLRAVAAVWHTVQTLPAATRQPRAATTRHVCSYYQPGKNLAHQGV